ncbi:MAG: hypothetical protein WAT70_15105 [Rhizobiaceae bacterium]
MRIVFLLIALAGVALGIVYPAVIEGVTGSEIGRFPVFAKGSGFKALTVDLDRLDAPVRVNVEAITDAIQVMPSAAAHLTLTVAAAGRTVLAERVLFTSRISPKDVPQEQTLAATAGVIDPVDTGSYLFVTALGDVDSLPLRSVDIILRRNATPVDERAQPVGYMLIVLGVIGFAVSLTRRRRDAPPPGPRWGRGGTA